MAEMNIGSRLVGDGHPTYFIADIAANHDGDLEQAKELIALAKEAGADAAKFQNFRAPNIVSKYGFDALGKQLSHQATWEKPVYEVYQDASIPWEWTPELKNSCYELGIDYFSAPYDLESVDMLDPYVAVYKVGSGDITFSAILHKLVEKGKPVLLSTGASDFADVHRAMQILQKGKLSVVLLQCNTNYTGSLENFRHLHLRVLQTYRARYPDVVLGLSDHTPGHAPVLGAVALGARVIEKHFTDDTSREGPDHVFSMTPRTWRDMVERTRELELALGSSNKFVTENEQETVVLQRRCLRAASDLKAGTILEASLLEALRPAPRDAIFPYDLAQVVGKRIQRDIPAGEYLRWTWLKDI
jgi:N-acetylneuraminate synthase